MTRAQYDSPWKLILERYFKELMTFFLPKVADEIDWNHPYQFLDKELLAIQKKAKVGNKIADKLIKVFTHEGEEKWVIVHLEIQGSKETDFPARMFEYYYRIYDKYKMPIMSMAILTDSKENWRPNTYDRSLWGCELSLRFPIIKLIDYEKQTAQLKESSNPITKVILAHLSAIRAKGDAKLRYVDKLNIVKQFYSLGYNGDDIRALYTFVDFVLSLPDNLEEEFMKNMHEHEDKVSMHYITSVERLSLKKGAENGKKELIETLLKDKFGSIPPSYLDRIHDASSDQIEKIGRKLLSSKNLDDLFE